MFHIRQGTHWKTTSHSFVKMDEWFRRNAKQQEKRQRVFNRSRASRMTDYQHVQVRVAQMLLRKNLAGKLLTRCIRDKQLQQKFEQDITSFWTSQMTSDNLAQIEKDITSSETSQITWDQVGKIEGVIVSLRRFYNSAYYAKIDKQCDKQRGDQHCYEQVITLLSKEDEECGEIPPALAETFLDLTHELCSHELCSHELDRQELCKQAVDDLCFNFCYNNSVDNLSALNNYLVKYFNPALYPGISPYSSDICKMYLLDLISGHIYGLDYSTECDCGCGGYYCECRWEGYYD
jgi:hypothetical protein